MHYLKPITALAIVLAVFTTSNTFVQAKENPPSPSGGSSSSAKKSEEKSTPATPKKAESVTVEVQPGDSLSSIADAHNVTWVRLFNANANIANPDVLNAGDKVRIPLADETLEDRYEAIRAQYETPPAPAVVAPVAASRGSSASTPRPVASTDTTTAVANSGNRYTWGTCTWYVFNRKPNIGSFWGNAGAWVGSAQAAGFAVGSTPVAGAIGVQGNHVVVVESVNGDTVSISEMNYAGGVGVVHYRTAPASSFYYIYA